MSYSNIPIVFTFLAKPKTQNSLVQQAPISLLNNHFLSKKIKNYITNRTNFDSFNKFKISLNENSIYLYYTKDELQIFIEKTQIEAKKLFGIVNEISENNKNLKKSRIESHIFFLDFPKKLDYSKDNITSSECNSGSTTFFSDYNEIIIWRKEEWQKVFLHELIHAFYLDTNLKIKPDKENELLKLFPHYNNSIFEAYTEILATILYCLEYSRDLKDETIFISSQCNKITSFLLGDRLRFRSEDFFKNPRILLDNSTNTSSYYFLKSMYFWNGSYNDYRLFQLETLLDKAFINEHFYDLFINTLKSKDYIDWLKKIFRVSKDNNLRLTSF